MRALFDNPSEPALDIYVGNLPYSATEDDLRNHFAPHAEVASVRIVTDRDMGRPRGFAFVTVDSESAARDAIRALDGQPMDGRPLRINEAERRPARSQDPGADADRRTRIRPPTVRPARSPVK